MVTASATPLGLSFWNSPIFISTPPQIQGMGVGESVMAYLVIILMFAVCFLMVWKEHPQPAKSLPVVPEKKPQAPSAPLPVMEVVGDMEETTGKTDFGSVDCESQFASWERKTELI